MAAARGNALACSPARPARLEIKIRKRNKTLQRQQCGPLINMRDCSDTGLPGPGRNCFSFSVVPFLSPLWRRRATALSRSGVAAAPPTRALMKFSESLLTGVAAPRARTAPRRAPQTDQARHGQGRCVRVRQGPICFRGPGNSRLRGRELRGFVGRHGTLLHGGASRAAVRCGDCAGRNAREIVGNVRGLRATRSNPLRISKQRKSRLCGMSYVVYRKKTTYDFLARRRVESLSSIRETRDQFREAALLGPAEPC